MFAKASFKYSLLIIYYQMNEILLKKKIEEKTY